MNCPRCQAVVPAGAARCGRCGATLPAAYEGETLAGASTAAPAPEPDATLPATAAGVATPPGASSGGINLGTGFWRPGAALAPAMEAGTQFGPRYQIEARLGEGGMGAVYRARDLELDRTVALKLVRPELVSDPAVMQRFKQELLLASRVSHKNILRIHDLGDVEGVKFISMAFVEGEDLHHRLARDGAMPVEQAVAMARQLAEALDAAHEAGVVHRDLKPQNVLVDANGNAFISDFGLAKSLEAGAMGMTRTGELMGTPRYMAPEQVQGGAIDHRTDLYAFGLIFYEMLTGASPFTGDSALQVMYQRVKQAPKKPREFRPDLPEYLERILLRCLERDPTRRYQSAREILADLDAERAPARTLQISLPRSRRGWMRAGGAVLAVAVVAASVLLWRGAPGPAAPGETVSLAILPFRNASGDASLDWLGASLAEILRSEVGQSAAVRSVTSDRLHQVLRDLRLTAGTEFDAATLRRIAEFTSADKLVWGRFVRIGEVIRIDAALEDLRNRRTTELRAEAAGEADLLPAIDRLARAIHGGLALPATAVRELEARAFSPSSRSIAALRHYHEGMHLVRQGNHIEAIRHFEQALAEDPAFALAHSRLAQAHATLGYSAEAESHSREAVELAASLPAHERHLIEANHARIRNDLDTAIEAYERLVELFPGEVQVRFDLAGLYESSGRYAEARKHYARVIEADPNYADALYAAGRTEIRAGNPQGSLDLLNRALSLAIQFDNPMSKSTTLQAIGIVYKLLGKPEDALRNYQESYDIKKQIGHKGGMAASLTEMAQVQEMMGQPDRAVRSYQEALGIRREIGDRRGLGITLINLGTLQQGMGNYDVALGHFREGLRIQLDEGNLSLQALCLLNIGVIHFMKAEYTEAQTNLERSLALREQLQVPGEIAEVRHVLAETALRVGQHEEALRHYLRALELWRGAEDRRGTAMASAGMGKLFGDQGRYAAALAAREEAWKTFEPLGDRTQVRGEMQAGYALALCAMNRQADARPLLDDALALGRELGNQRLVALALTVQGHCLAYAGELRGARARYEQAAQAAAATPDQHLQLSARLNVARVAVLEGRGGTALPQLRRVIREAESLRLRAIAAEASAAVGDALRAARDLAGARRELESALRQSEDLGMRVLQAEIRSLLARALRAAGDTAGAERHAGHARRLLEEILAEAGTPALANRADLKRIAEGTTLVARG